MTAFDERGWYNKARHCPSPHCDARPADEVDLLVVHAISLPPGMFGTGDPLRLFTGTLDFDAHPFYRELRDLRVSAHFLIDREGGLTQCVGVHDRAWHAGVSVWKGRPACNDYSVGVELEGTAGLPFTDAQYRALAALALDLMAFFPGMTVDRIVGHSDVAPGRKWDPGTRFDWGRLREALMHG